MEAKVISMAKWKATHPPILKLWNAQCRFVAEWNVALFRLSFAPLLPQISNRRSQDIEL